MSALDALRAAVDAVGVQIAGLEQVSIEHSQQAFELATLRDELLEARRLVDTLNTAALAFEETLVARDAEIARLRAKAGE